MTTQPDQLKHKENKAKAWLMVMFFTYVAWFFGWCVLKFHYFSYDDFDLAIHDQIIWNILHGRIFNSILGVDFLGNHAHFISFLVAPFYLLFPHPLFLLFLQTVFLAAGAFPLYALARGYHSCRLSLIIAAAYLLYPGLGYTNLYEFHPTCFAVFFILCTAYYFYKENFFFFNIFMALSLLCQENIALIFMMWGFYALILRRELKWVWWPVCLGLVYFLCCVYIILPGFNKNTFNFFHIYGPLGDSFGKVVQTCIFHPVKVAAILFQPQKMIFLAQLFISLLFIPFFSPLSLLPAFLIFMQHLLSSRLSEVSLHYHYTAELIPFIFIAFVFGLKKIFPAGSKHKILGYILFFNALFVNLIMGPHFCLMRDFKIMPFKFDVEQNEAMLDQIPKEASVVATFEYLPHLSHREDLYSFHHVYSGFYTLFTKPYQLPDRVQYALIDFNDFLTFYGFYGYSHYRNIDQFLKKGPWGTMDVRDTIVLFKKGEKDRFPLFSIINGPIAASHPINLTVDNKFELLGYDVKAHPDHIHLIYYWKVLQSEQKDVNLRMEFMDQDGKMIESQYRPICYRIWPTQAWQKGQLIEEHQYVSISPRLRGHLKYLKIGFFDLFSGQSIPTDSHNRGGWFRLNLTDK